MIPLERRLKVTYFNSQADMVHYYFQKVLNSECTIRDFKDLSDFQIFREHHLEGFGRPDVLCVNKEKKQVKIFEFKNRWLQLYDLFQIMKYKAFFNNSYKYPKFKAKMFLVGTNIDRECGFYFDQIKDLKVSIVSIEDEKITNYHKGWSYESHCGGKRYAHYRNWYKDLDIDKIPA